MPQIHADPYAWLLTGPLAVILFVCYVQPADGGLKQAWEQLTRMQAHSWTMVTGRQWFKSPLERLQRALYWVAVALLLLGTAASLSAFFTSI